MKFVFDFGGVLFRWRPAELLARALPAHAARAEALAKALFQGEGGDWAAFDRGTVAPAALVPRLAARTGLAEAEVQAVLDAVPEALRPIPESVALLARLRDAGARLFFLSNMPAPYADDLERRHDFLGWFESGVFSARVQAIKPEPAIFRLAQARFGVPAAELMFFDDHAPNVEAAHAAGWQALHFSDAAACEAALRERGVWPG